MEFANLAIEALTDPIYLATGLVVSAMLLSGLAARLVEPMIDSAHLWSGRRRRLASTPNGHLFDIGGELDMSPSTETRAPRVDLSGQVGFSKPALARVDGALDADDQDRRLNRCDHAGPRPHDVSIGRTTSEHRYSGGTDGASRLAKSLRLRDLHTLRDSGEKGAGIIGSNRGMKHRAGVDLNRLALVPARRVPVVPTTNMGWTSTN